MKYLTDALDIKINTKPWSEMGDLPYYLTDNYDFEKVLLDGVSCLFLTPKKGLDTLTAIKKHIRKVNELDQVPVVLNLSNIDSRRRKSLIEARIPFVVIDSQIYLPFMGTLLSERYKVQKTNPENLMPSSQLLLFYYIYQNKSELYTRGLAEKFSLSDMQVSRAIAQLKALGLFFTYKDGVRIVVYSDKNQNDLFESAKPHIINPIRKVIYVEKNKKTANMPLSGISALSERTMLGEPLTKTVAYYGKNDGLPGTDFLIDNNTQAEVEFWKYNPTLLSKSENIVDTLSLAVSLQSNDDPRVELAVEQMLEELWENN